MNLQDLYNRAKNFAINANNSVQNTAAFLGRPGAIAGTAIRNGVQNYFAPTSNLRTRDVVREIPQAIATTYNAAKSGNTGKLISKNLEQFDYFKPTPNVRIRDYVREVPTGIDASLKMLAQDIARFGISLAELPSTFKNVQATGNFYDTPVGRVNSFQSEAQNRIQRGDPMWKAIGNPALDTVLAGADVGAIAKPILGAAKQFNHFGKFGAEIRAIAGDFTQPLNNKFQSSFMNSMQNPGLIIKDVNGNPVASHQLTFPKAKNRAEELLQNQQFRDRKIQLGRPKVSQLMTYSPEFKQNPILNFQNGMLEFKGKSNNFKLKPKAIGLNPAEMKNGMSVDVSDIRLEKGKIPVLNELKKTNPVVQQDDVVTNALKSNQERLKKQGWIDPVENTLGNDTPLREPARMPVDPKTIEVVGAGDKQGGQYAVRWIDKNGEMQATSKTFGFEEDAQKFADRLKNSISKSQPLQEARNIPFKKAEGYVNGDKVVGKTAEGETVIGTFKTNEYYKPKNEGRGGYRPVIETAGGKQYRLGEARGDVKILGKQISKPLQEGAKLPPVKPPKTPTLKLRQPEGKQRGFIKTVRKSDKPMGEVAQGVDSYYQTAFNKDTMEAANRSIAQDFEGAVHRAKTETTPTRQLQAESMRLIDELQAKGRTQEAIDILEKMSERATEGGQASQILSAYNRLTPEGILMMAQRQIKKAKELNPSKYENLKLKPEDASKLRKMAEEVQGLTGEAKDLATRKMLEEIERLAPTPWARKLTTLWKAGLLTGIKGAVGGNTIGNTAMAFMRKLSDVPASMLDSAIAKLTGNRSKVFTLKGILGGFGEGLKEGFVNMKKGVGAGEMVNKLDYQKTYFGKGILGRAAQKYTDTVFNFYSASDRPFYRSALKNSLYDLVKVEAKNAGLKGKQAQTFIDKLVKEPTDEIITRAISEAQNAVFQGKNAVGAGLSGLKQGAKRYGGSAGEIISEGVLPFTGVPSAIATAVHNYSPSGIVAGVFKALVQAKNGGLTQAGQRELSEALGKGLTGTAVMWLGMKLTDSGQMTLGYPKDPGERTLWEQEGKIPYAIKVNGKWRSLNYTGPIMSLLAIGGEIQNADNTGLGAIGTGLAGSGKAIVGSSPLQGMQAGLDAITDPQRYGDSYFRNQASSVIPTLMKDVAVAGDPTQREVNTVGDALQSKVPGMRNSLLPKRDFFGEEVPRATSAIGSIIDPFRSSEARGSAETKELRRLQDAGVGPTMSKIDKNQKIYGQNVKLTPEELDTLEQAGGGQIKQALQQVMSSPEYQELPDEDKQTVINNVVNGIRKQAREGMVDGTVSLASFDYGKISSDSQLEMKKKAFETSDKNIEIVGDKVLRKREDGTVYTQSKAKYDTQVINQRLERAKKNEDIKGWMKYAEQKYVNLQKQLNDPNTDQLEKETIQNDIDDLENQYAKYAGYGGFTKPKKGKKSSSSSFKIKGFDMPKISGVSGKIKLSAPPKRKRLKLSTKKVKIKFNKTQAPSASKRLV